MVSKALRGHPDISRETTKLVKQTAEELGYTPNFAARNLSSRKSNTIGVVVPKVAHFFFSALIKSIYDTAFYNNYDIALTVSQENADRERKHIETLLAMGVDGLIVSISQLYQRKPNWIDFNAGQILDGVMDADALTTQFFNYVLDVASGKIKTCNETNDYREIAIWKEGVTL